MELVPHDEQIIKVLVTGGDSSIRKRRTESELSVAYLSFKPPDLLHYIMSRTAHRRNTVVIRDGLPYLPDSPANLTKG